MPDLPHLRTIDLCRYYRHGRGEVRALDGITLEIPRGELVAIVGASGSGKSTLLNLLAGLDTPTAGRIEIGGEPLWQMNRKQLAGFRASQIGIVFQSFNLIAHYTALQNVETALLFTNVSKRDRRKQAAAALDLLGLSDRATHRPADLSGGEQQRVALARALVKKPELLFADEPTGNLDQENAQAVLDIFRQLRQQQITVMMVTHNLELARNMADRIVRLQYGKVIENGPGNAATGVSP